MKSISLRKITAVLLSVLMTICCFTTGVFAYGDDVDMEMGDVTEGTSKAISGKYLIENWYSVYEGADVSGNAATLNEDAAFL